MAGNKKPSRVAKNRPSVIQRREAADFVQRDREEQIARMCNLLPMGHDVNRHKVDSVFGAIAGYLDEIERSGESPADARGTPVVVDPHDGDELPAALAFTNQHTMFGELARRYGWGRAPDGLRRMAAKLSAGMLLFDSDIADARTALAWMRVHVEDVTPNQWSDALNAMIEQEKQAIQAAQAAARKAA